MKLLHKFFTKKDDKPKDMASKLPKVNLPKMPAMPKNLNLKLPANINMKTVTDLMGNVIKSLKNPQKSGEPRTGIPMKFPYTLGAKIAQFPYMYYYKNNWIAGYLPVGFVACLPLMWYIHRMVNSKENKQKWKLTRQKEHEYAKHRWDY